MTAPRLASYDWRGGREAMLRFGPERGATVIAAPPLFEEANRTRAAIVDVLRRLAAIGIAGALPDLPGTGESMVPTIDARLSDWHAAFAAAAAALPQPVVAMAWRGGVLVDADADLTARWHLAPTNGATTVRELERVRAVASGDDYAGNRLHPELIEGLRHAVPTTIEPIRIVRLVSDPRPADRHLTGSPLWRASEPITDDSLQTAIVEDVAGWVARCVG